MANWTSELGSNSVIISFEVNSDKTGSGAGLVHWAPDGVWESSKLVQGDPNQN